MNNITLYLIPGINKIDTPVFDTEEHQETFFASQTNLVIDNNSFYVPKFKDVISLDITDIEFTSSFNYLSLYFGEKYYYYFISKIDYVNETVVNVSVEMDVIQTYMFNANFIHSEITRKSIKRWVPETPLLNKINRDYIRENIGNGMFKHYKSSLYANDVIIYVFHLMPANNIAWYKLTEQGNPDPGYIPYITEFRDGDKKYTDCGCYLVLPVKVSAPYDGTYVSDFDTVHISKSRMIRMFRYMMERDYIFSINVLPGIYLSSLGIQYNSQTNTFTKTSNNQSVKFLRFAYSSAPDAEDIECMGYAVYTTEYVYNVQEFDIPKASATEHVGDFTENTNPAQTFSWQYCPQLLDENYTQIKYGEPSYMAGYPLHLLDRDVVNMYVEVNPITNVRVYSFALTPDVDYYLTMVYAVSDQQLQLYNNPYQSYLAQKSATLSAGFGLALGDRVYSRLERLGLNYDDRVSYGIAGGGIFRDMMVTTAKHFIKQFDLMHTPDTTRNNSNGIYDTVSENIAPRYLVKMVTNIKECAEYFETFGYKVHEIYTGNLFTINNRFYYDYVEADNVNLYLSGAITDNETITHIQERLLAGLRMWHTTNGALNCESVTGVTLTLGQVCLYDNVEV